MIKSNIIFIIAVLLMGCTKEVNNNHYFNEPDPKQQTTGTDVVAPTTGDGVINGGGGKGVVCTGPANKKTVELLDLYEAKVLYGLGVGFKADTEDEAITKLAELIHKHYNNPWTDPDDNKVIELTKKGIRQMVVNKIKFIEADKKLKASNDSFEPLVAKNCEIAQIALYYDESTLLVDKNLWDQLDWTNRAALVAHEAFYFMHREKGARNSIMTRKLVGQLFSTKGAVPVYSGLPQDESKRIQCFLNNGSGATVGYFEGYETTKAESPFSDDKVNGVEFIFSSLFKQPILFKTSLFFPSMELSFFVPGSSQLEASNSSPLYIEGYDNVKVTAYLDVHTPPQQDCKECGNISPIPFPQEPKPDPGTVQPTPEPVPISNQPAGNVPPDLEPVDPNQPPASVYVPVIKLHLIDEGSDQQEAQSYTVDCGNYKTSKSHFVDPVVQPQPIPNN